MGVWGRSGLRPEPPVRVAAATRVQPRASAVAWLLLVSHTGMCLIRSLLLTGFDQDAQQYASRLGRQRGRGPGGRITVTPSCFGESVAIASTIPFEGMVRP
jgi:hypothetical protein